MTSLKLQKKLVFYLILANFFLMWSISMRSHEREEKKIKLDDKSVLLSSKCKCRPDMVLKKISQNEYSVNGSYSLATDELNQMKFSCNFYNQLYRGKNIKVISYSLYGKSSRYYYFLKTKLVRLINKFYPDWIVRIYHDNSIDERVICQLECLPFNNVDFCDITRLPAMPPVVAE